MTQNNTKTTAAPLIYLPRFPAHHSGHTMQILKPSSQYCHTAVWHGFHVVVAHCAVRIEPSSILAVNARHDTAAVHLL